MDTGQEISCRICRDTTWTKKIKFELNSAWSSLFEFCLGFQIAETGPLAFCESCRKKLHDYADFKHLCLQSEEIWKSATNHLTVKNIVKEEECIEETSKYPDIFDHVDNDYNVPLIVKEDKEENLIKKLENNLTEISIKKIDKPPITNEEFTTPLKTRKTFIRNSKKTNHIKCAVKKDKKLKSLKSSKTKESVEQETTDLFCGLCRYTATSSEDLNQHLVQHCQANVLNCQLCKFVGRDVAHMVAHRYTHCSQKGTNMKCPMCSELCFNSNKLQFHYRTVHLKTNGGLCIVCGRSFKSYKQWKTHERVHLLRNFICDHCGMSFHQRCLIEEHMVVHYDVFKFMCDYCGKGFKKLDNLKSHFFTHRIEHNKVSCNICNIKFKHEKSMQKHMLQQHSEKKMFCKICSKGFSTNRMLGYHMYYYHSDEKPFACDLCGARYRSNLSLKIHKRKHTGELPYPCPECGKGFSSSSACKRHQCVHTGVRPIKCLHCDKTFYLKKLMQAHLNSKHKDAVLKGEVKS